LRLSGNVYNKMAEERLNESVTKFLDDLSHPLQAEINELRRNILSANSGLSENIKWNGPNYSLDGDDRITMKIHPPKQIQLIFHRGAKVLKQPDKKLIDDNSGVLTWRGNDRAFASFTNMKEILSNKDELKKIVNDWLEAAR
jgi:hypothetical protein